jgi:hypothetical protein
MSGGRAAAWPFGWSFRGEKLNAVARRVALLVVPAFAIVLFLAWGDFKPHGSSDVGFEPAELNSSELPSQAAREPLEGQPALKRGGVASSAVESSRRKLKLPQRPTAEPLVLTSRFIAEGLRGTHTWPPTWSGPPIKHAQPDWAFLARGPPLWNHA